MEETFILKSKLTDGMREYPIERSDAWMELAGEIPVAMTNDYLFRALMQSDEVARIGLIACLLGVQPEDIVSATIENPIQLGSTTESKEFIMDVLVCVNGAAYVNVELQVSNQKNWPDRSLAYACRAFDHLNQGDGYTEVKPVYHFGFLDFTLDEEKPSFFSRYRLADEGTGRVYTEKFIMATIDLTRVDLATEADKEQGLDRWAKLFKAKKWEDLRMIAKEDKAIGSAVSSMSQLMDDFQVMWLARERADFLNRERWRENKLNELAETIIELGDTKEKLGKAEEKLGKAEEKLGKTEEKLGKTEEKLGKAEEKLGKAEEKLGQTEKKLGKAEDALLSEQQKVAELMAEVERLKKQTEK